MFLYRWKSNVSKPALSQEHIRLVGLSATLPNYEDVAVFLRVWPHGFAMDAAHTEKKEKIHIMFIVCAILCNCILNFVGTLASHLDIYDRP